MVDILMAVYNGEKFVAEQIDSILAQSETDWHLIICDDMSKDRSFEIISGYVQKYPDKISAHKNAVPTGSAQAPGKIEGVLPNLGLGLRIEVQPRMNVRLDFGRDMVNKQNLFYFNMTEAF